MSDRVRLRVLCFGNPLHGDDGYGPAVALALRKQVKCAGADIVDCGNRGLDAALGWILERGVDALRAHGIDMSAQLIDGLRAINGVTVYGPRDPQRQTATVSFTLAGISPSDAGFWLDDEFGIQCRIGLHCAPSAHRTIGTFPAGTIRFAPGAFCQAEEIARALAAVRSIAGRRS